jgi:hypothetical protein
MSLDELDVSRIAAMTGFALSSAVILAILAI